MVLTPVARGLATEEVMTLRRTGSSTLVNWRTWNMGQQAHSTRYSSIGHVMSKCPYICFNAVQKSHNNLADQHVIHMPISLVCM